MLQVSEAETTLIFFFFRIFSILQLRDVMPMSCPALVTALKGAIVA
jgi:hypothetical protein